MELKKENEKGKTTGRTWLEKLREDSKSCLTGLFFSYHPRALLGPRFTRTERRKGINQSLTIENKIDWFRRSGFWRLNRLDEIQAELPFLFLVTLRSLLAG